MPSLRCDDGGSVREKAPEARPLEVVWVALCSILVLMLMMLYVDVPAR
jgi:hypothetical protein